MDWASSGTTYTLQLQFWTFVSVTEENNGTGNGKVVRIGMYVSQTYICDWLPIRSLLTHRPL
jgi:hypothetical protein